MFPLFDYMEVLHENPTNHLVKISGRGINCYGDTPRQGWWNSDHHKYLIRICLCAIPCMWILSRAFRVHFFLPSVLCPGCAFWIQPLLVFTEWFTPSASYCWCHVFTRARTYLGDMDIFRYCKQNYQADLLFELVVRFTSLKSCPKKGAAQHGEREIFNNFS